VFSVKRLTLECPTIAAWCQVSGCSSYIFRRSVPATNIWLRSGFLFLMAFAVWFHCCMDPSLSTWLFSVGLPVICKRDSNVWGRDDWGNWLENSTVFWILCNRFSLKLVAVVERRGTRSPPTECSAGSLFFARWCPQFVWPRRRLWSLNPILLGSWWRVGGPSVCGYMYIGTYAVLMRRALCSRSVGGVVTSILHFTSLGSACLMVAWMVFSTVELICMPRCCILSGV